MARRRMLARAGVAAVVALAALTSCGSDDGGSSTASAVSTASTGLPTTAAPTTDARTTTTATPATTSTSSATATTAPGTTVPSATDVARAEPLTVAELLALGRPIVLAHGGGEDERPHSTPFAFGESVRAGVDVLDMDVQLTADGVLVVHHDDDVDRTTDGTGDVAAMTYDELHRLDDAYWFTPACVCRDQPDAAYVYRGIRTGERPPPDGYSADDFAIPRFEDLLTRFPSLPVNVEIKGAGDAGAAAARELARILAAHDRLDSSVVSSFDDATVAAYSAAAPGAEVSPGLGASAAFILDGTPLPEGMRILQLPPEFNGLDVLSPANVTRAHAAGYVIWVWPNDRALEDRDSYLAFLRAGMDGLNINFPATGVDALAEFLGGQG